MEPVQSETTMSYFQTAMQVSQKFTDPHCYRGYTVKLFNADGSLFNLEKTMVTVLLKEPEYNVEKLKCKKVGGHAVEDQNQIRTFTCQTNHPRSVHTKFYSHY